MSKLHTPGSSERDYADGKYLNVCRVSDGCNKQFWGPKHMPVCKKCSETGNTGSQ